MENKRVTVRDIAEKAGVHFTTVSRALSRHPSIPAATCNRIRKIADELHYVPDPMLSALTAYRTRLSTPTFHGTLAWLTNGISRNSWNCCETFDLYQKGASHRAQELGYHLEEFWLREPGMSRQRIESILAARNIRGLILSPQPRYKTRVQLEWSRFAAVTFGFTLAWPQLHIVTAHCFQAMQEAITQVRSLGYRRLGLAVTSVTDQRVNRSWSGAFLGLQQHWPAQSRIPIHIPPAITHSGFMKWVKTYKPDVVISQELGLLDVLEENGFKVPQDIGFATQTITSYTHTRAISGIDENPMEAGTAAVNMVVAMINRGEYGISPINHHVLIRGTWKEGDTLVRQNGSRSELEVAESKPEDELGT